MKTIAYSPATPYRKLSSKLTQQRFMDERGKLGAGGKGEKDFVLSAKHTEPKFVNLSRCPGIDSQPV
jgi:hypothetical protein